MITCKNLVKLFDANSGIKNINLRFSPGRIYGIIGYNGAGKTTLLNCLAGLCVPTSGSVYHDSVKTTDEKGFLPYRRKISFVPSVDYLYTKLTCGENMELATILRTGKNKILKETRELIAYFEADSFLHKKFKDCSTGMKKKIQIIISLIGEVDTIIWDEPNDGLDIISNMKIKKLLNYYKSKNMTVLFSCHVIEFLEDFADYYILLKDGNVVEEMEANGTGSPHELYLNHADKDSLSLPFP
ncbi:MAG: ABC transporter ATP-binding protein, partial [Treponema sp.]|nr:ABC transporter ATP-binding protein [Treponema sp.]